MGETESIFFHKCLSATLRILAFAWFLLLHKGLSWFLTWVIPTRFSGFLGLAEAIVAVCFVMIYVYLAYDALVVFMPALKRPAYRGQVQPVELPAVQPRLEE
jgi:hypothetical protein